MAHLLQILYNQVRNFIHFHVTISLDIPEDFYFTLKNFTIFVALQFWKFRSLLQRKFRLWHTFIFNSRCRSVFDTQFSAIKFDDPFSPQDCCKPVSRVRNFQELSKKRTVRGELECRRTDTTRQSTGKLRPEEEDRKLAIVCSESTKRERISGWGIRVVRIVQFKRAAGRFIVFEGKRKLREGCWPVN